MVISQPDGSSNGFIDLYKRGSFVLVAKQTGRTLDSSGWDKAILETHNQADQYARVSSNAPPTRYTAVFAALRRAGHGAAGRRPVSSCQLINKEAVNGQG